ncbi:hypothetical protein GCM10007897_17920 [Sphingobium jiangsuense]|uniref:Flp pilus assembly protein TadB n=1 Tax=Sphingobium jiangsuense TaxID=870476 RepID=A0A7W6BLB5_9SPHN|nr:Flp pilus assembly protein TadB [Sphingobium jiangsuense]GLT00406.1 hypothetical protein GCM10007897_17920 [Sphingobium jiangsuense]
MLLLALVAAFGIAALLLALVVLLLLLLLIALLAGLLARLLVLVCHWFILPDKRRGVAP